MGLKIATHASVSVKPKNTPADRRRTAARCTMHDKQNFVLQNVQQEVASGASKKQRHHSIYSPLIFLIDYMNTAL
jgi:hypothetical protein